MNICSMPKMKPSMSPQPRPQRRAKRNMGTMARSTEPPCGISQIFSLLSISASASIIAASQSINSFMRDFVLFMFTSPFLSPRRAKTKRGGFPSRRALTLSYVGITRIRFQGTGLN